MRHFYCMLLYVAGIKIGPVYRWVVDTSTPRDERQFTCHLQEDK